MTMSGPRRARRVSAKEIVMNRRLIRECSSIVVLFAVALLPSFVPLLAQSPASAFDLSGPLKASPGCLGVEVSRTASGKQVIFAWFENKAAVVNWYNSQAHRQAQQRFFPGFSSGRAPLGSVPDDSGPIMVIA